MAAEFYLRRNPAARVVQRFNGVLFVDGEPALAEHQNANHLTKARQAAARALASGDVENRVDHFGVHEE